MACIVVKEDFDQGSGNTYHIGPFMSFDQAAEWADRQAYEAAEHPSLEVDGALGEVFVRDEAGAMIKRWTVQVLTPVK